MHKSSRKNQPPIIPFQPKLPIKVLHIIQGKHFGGAEQVVLTLARCLNSERVTSSVCCFERGLLSEKLSHYRIPNYLIQMKSRRNILIPLLRMIKLARRIEIDIIHTHSVRSNLIGRMAALFSGKRCITHLHSPVLRDFADFRRGKINEIIDSFTRPIAFRYIAVSHSLRKEMIKKGMQPDKIYTVHNAVDFKSLKTSITGNHKKLAIREEFSISQDAIILVLVALLRPRKGVEVIIKAMKSILQNFSNVFLLIVGNDDISEDPEYGKKLRELTFECGIQSNVIFTGFRNDVPFILSQCNLMILPSLFGEGLPMVILEAMSLGVPVIASKIEGVPEIIEDGVNGFLVSPGNVEQLSNKIIRVMSDPELLRIVKNKAQKKVINEMNINIYARKIEKIYLGALV